MCELTTLKVDRGEQGQEGTSQQTVRAYWSHDVTTSCDVMSFLSTPQPKKYILFLVYVRVGNIGEGKGDDARDAR